MMRTNKAKKGITPVVTMIILVLIALTVAVSAYAWVTQFQEGTQEQVQEQAENLDRGISIQSLECYNENGAGSIEVWFKNSGSTTLDLDPVDMLITPEGSDSADPGASRTELSLYNDSLSEDINITDGNSDFRSSGASANYIINTTEFGGGNSYNIEFVFTDEGELTVREDCGDITN